MAIVGTCSINLQSRSEKTFHGAKYPFWNRLWMHKKEYLPYPWLLSQKFSDIIEDSYFRNCFSHSFCRKVEKFGRKRSRKYAEKSGIK